MSKNGHSRRPVQGPLIADAFLSFLPAVIGGNPTPGERLNLMLAFYGGAITVATDLLDAFNSGNIETAFALLNKEISEFRRMTNSDD